MITTYAAGPLPQGFVPPVGGSLRLIGSITTVDGFGNVQSWPDQSGSGNNFVQNPDPSRRPSNPLYKGAKAVLFDGAGDYLLGPLLSSVISAAAFSFYLVVETASYINVNVNPHNNYYLNDGIVQDEGSFFAATVIGGVDQWVTAIWDGGPEPLFFPEVNGTRALFSGRFGAGTFKSRIDNGLESSTPSGNVQDLTGLMNLGGGYLRTRFWNGYAWEILFWPRALTDPEDASVRMYLTTTYP